MIKRMSKERVEELAHTDRWTQSDCADVEDEMLRARKAEETLADMAQNLYAIALPLMRETDSIWHAMREEYVAAMKLAGRDPKI